MAEMGPKHRKEPKQELGKVFACQCDRIQGVLAPESLGLETMIGCCLVPAAYRWIGWSMILPPISSFEFDY